MVVSNIDKNLNYSEKPDINPSDNKKQGQLYQIMLNGLNVIITVGNQKNTTRNISYFPIYLVKSNNTVIQIGVYEMLTTKVNKYIDHKTKTLIIEKLDGPLIYEFVTKQLLQKIRKIPSFKIKDDDIQEEIEPLHVNKNISEKRQGLFTLMKNTTVQKPLTKETQKDALDIRQRYHPSESDIWINQFMHNKHYFIDLIEGSDTCFFTAIKDSFATIGHFTTVEKLKTKLGECITEATFTRFRKIYDLLTTTEEKIKTQLKQLQSRNAELRIKITQTINVNLQEQIKLEGEKNLVLFNKLKNDKTLTDAYLHEYRFMKGVTTMEEFVKKLKTCDFWVETWAISVVEKMLNVKFIILLSDEYKNGDLSSVLHCGNLTTQEMIEPEFYIILTKSKNTYHLVSYKNRKIFTSDEVPYDIKKLITDKCTEKNAGDFMMIPEFTNYDTEPPINPEHIDLFDDNTVFRFHEKSANRAPGKNNGEKINIERVFEFMDLGGIADWRKKLANTWVQPFILDGHKWSSVEHFYQASKFKKSAPDFYLDFSLDSNTELSKNVDMAKTVGENTDGKYKGVVVKEPHTKADPSFALIKSKVLHDAQYAKFSQNKELNALLKYTRDAKLVYHIKGKHPEVYYELMVVRSELN
jgi:predicted NAD-dependent protein-ADP-ribosyltransferase YbiA (DUF1768 family)